MTDDPRYRYAHSIFNMGELFTFNEIFDIVPKSIICKDLVMNYGRFAKKANKPESLTFKELIKLSELLRIDAKSLSDMVLRQISENKDSSLRKHK